MMLTKGKHSFWSQLFISMIAIFALPDVQAVDRTEHLNTYQNQSIQQQTLRTIYQVHQEKAQAAQIQQSGVVAVKLTEFQPHFVAAIHFAHAPIRGSPLA
ncbi:secA translation cis-regulator SecM [Pasteurellaceae bacterium 22721_9_1]